MVAVVPGRGVPSGGVPGRPELAASHQVESRADAAVVEADVSRFDEAPGLGAPLCAALQARVGRAQLSPGLQRLTTRIGEAAKHRREVVKLSARERAELMAPSTRKMLAARTEGVLLAAQLRKVAAAAGDPVAQLLAERVHARFAYVAERVPAIEREIARMDASSPKLWLEKAEKGGAASHPLGALPEDWDGVAAEVAGLTKLLAASQVRTAERDRALASLRTAVLRAQSGLERQPRADAQAVGLAKDLADPETLAKLAPALAGLAAAKPAELLAAERAMVAPLARLDGVAKVSELAAGLRDNSPLVRDRLRELAQGAADLHEKLVAELADAVSSGWGRRERSQKDAQLVNTVLGTVDWPLRALRTTLGLDAGPALAPAVPTPTLSAKEELELAREPLQAMDTVLAQSRGLATSGLVRDGRDAERLLQMPGYGNTSARLFEAAVARGDANPRAPLKMDAETLAYLYECIRERAVSSSPLRVKARFVRGLLEELEGG